MPSTPDTLAVLASGLADSLRKLDPDVVPAVLDKVLAHTGKRLTPPLVRILVDEVDRNEWLRERLVEHVDPANEPIAAAFVRRDDGWWRQLIVVERTTSTKRAANASDRQLERIKDQRDEAKRRLRDLRTEHDAVSAELRRLRDRHRREATAATSGGDGANSARLSELESEIDALRQERDAMEERVGDLMRRRPEPQQRRSAGTRATARVFGRTTPVGLARRLDLEFAALARTDGLDEWTGTRDDTRDDSGDSKVAEAARIRLPGGVAPDSPDAVRWLTENGQPAHVIVDGYNVTFLIDPVDFRAGPVRRRLVDSLARLQRLLPTASRLEVVFDSAEGVDTEPTVTPAGVTVRFTASGVIADDDIVATVEDSVGPTVVVSNDRDLRSRSERAGALALWGDALVRWLAG